MMAPDLPAAVLEIARRIAAAGGRAVLVGGFVRDHLLGTASKDLDVEVFGLEPAALAAVLAEFGEVIEIGRAFGVMRVKGLDVDFSLPRRDSKTGPGHRGFDVQVDPHLRFEEAARRRDLRVNSMGWDPLSGEVLDPFDGRADLRARVLRATDATRFAEDPLRGLRAAQLTARLDMHPDAELRELCAGLDLAEVSPERVLDELVKLLVKGVRPSAGLAFIHEAGLLHHFPELDALVGVPQDPLWHPEGDVWTHTLMVVDEAARLRDECPPGDRTALMFGALCHDLGKPLTTVVEDGRVRSPAHDQAGVEPTRALLGRLRAARTLVTRVCALVEHHLAPALFVKNDAGGKGYRRLLRKLDAAGVSVSLLLGVARADHLGRTTEDALARRFDAGERFRELAGHYADAGQALRDAVQGRHLIARGLRPGPEFGALLARCRDVQDRTGWTDPERILDEVLPGGR